MSRPAAVIPRTEHPDYVAALNAKQAADRTLTLALNELNVERAVIAECAVEDHLLPIEPRRQAYLDARAAYEAAVNASERAFDDFLAVRVRLGLAR